MSLVNRRSQSIGGYGSDENDIKTNSGLPEYFGTCLTTTSNIPGFAAGSVIVLPYRFSIFR
jgi:hypothetical protein